MDAVRRSSIANLTRRRSGSADRKSKDKDKDKDKVATQHKSAGPPVTFDIIAESPPALLLGPPEQSSGALYAFKLKLKIAGTSPVTLTALKVTLNVCTTTKRPVAEKCPDCAVHTTTLKEWNLLSQPKTFAVDEYAFPLSYLIPGNAQVTTKGHIGNTEYRFHASATSETKEAFEYSKPLFVNRALRRGNDKNAKRIFPPLSICMNVTTPSVVFPTGPFNIMAHMTGVTCKLADRSMRWRLSKLDWRIVEKEKFISPACRKHIASLGGQGDGVAHEHTRVLAAAELRSGWKSDYAEDSIDCEIVCTMEAASRANTTVQPTAGGHLTMSHALHIELVFAEDLVMNDRPGRATPTGNARVLRTQFPLVVTTRSGMGVAWDDEQPPLYEDVPESPPVYPHQVQQHDAPGLVAGSVERIQLGV